MTELKKRMNIKKTITFLIFAVLIIDAVIFLSIQTQLFAKKSDASSAQSAAVKNIDSTIAVEGTITAQDQATLHFQTGGKLISVPLKEGDKVTEGQTIAQLDTYPLQQQLTIAVNNLRTTKEANDQTQQNTKNNVLQSEQSKALRTAGAGLVAEYGTNTQSTDYLDQVVQKIADESQNGVNSAQATVAIQNYALQMASLTSPLTGVVIHEDVDIAGQNVTPTTSFIVADPTTKVFRANIPTSDIDYISEGMNATLMLDGAQNKITGTIIKVYPSKTTLASGEQVYQVDIQADEVTSKGKLDQTGTAIIMTNAENVTLVPAWTVLSDKYVWVVNNNKPVLRTITVSATHGDQIEVTSGLATGDRVITDPKLIPSRDYQML
jgi:RND family efflux transporter MFP subunit